MIFIEPKSYDSAFHFATEEFCMNHFPPGTIIWMLWRTNNCIMLGSNQVPELEIDMKVAKEHGIQIVRRPSGGGTIFTDPATIQYTVIMPYHKEMDTKQAKEQMLAAPILEVINKELSVPANLEGRNDIIIDGRKISGLAQHIGNNRLCSHGSLLYDTDLDILDKVLNPGNDKITSKSITSVKSRVTNLKSHMTSPMDTDSFFRLFKDTLISSNQMEEYTLTEYDITRIYKIRLEKYANDRWTYGKTPKFTYHNRVKYPMGIVEVYLTVNKGVVTECSIRGDFLGLIPIATLEEAIIGLDYQRDAVEIALSQINLRVYLGGITREQLLDTLF